MSPLVFYCTFAKSTVISFVNKEIPYLHFHHVLKTVFLIHDIGIMYVTGTSYSEGLVTQNAETPIREEIGVSDLFLRVADKLLQLNLSVGNISIQGIKSDLYLFDLGQDMF